MMHEVEMKQILIEVNGFQLSGPGREFENLNLAHRNHDNVDARAVGHEAERFVSELLITTLLRFVTSATSLTYTL